MADRKEKKFTLPERSGITQEMINQLDLLVSRSSPDAIRKSILQVYMRYIISDYDALPGDFEDIACDFYLLIEFFTRVEEEMQQQ